MSDMPFYNGDAEGQVFVLEKSPGLHSSWQLRICFHF